MKNALIIYLDKDSNTKMEYRQGVSYDSRVPKDWGLDKNCAILVVFQNGTFTNAWVEGQVVDPRRLMA